MVATAVGWAGNRPGQCNDTQVHERHTWGWPRTDCDGRTEESVRAQIRKTQKEVEREMAIATQMARTFHEEQTRLALEYQDAGGPPVEWFEWEALPPHHRERMARAMLVVLVSMPVVAAGVGPGRPKETSNA